jgi:hypothetical protein
MLRSQNQYKGRSRQRQKTFSDSSATWTFNRLPFGIDMPVCHEQIGPAVIVEGEARSPAKVRARGLAAPDSAVTSENVFSAVSVERSFWRAAYPPAALISTSHTAKSVPDLARPGCFHFFSDTSSALAYPIVAKTLRHQRLSASSLRYPIFSLQAVTET